MRLSNLLVPMLAFLAAALLCVFAARAAVEQVEDRSVEAVREALLDEGQGWASVLGDGLQVILEGEAPSEAVRFRAMTIAGTMVDASRVIDNMSVEDDSGIVAPEFAIEILRNDSGVSLIGLIPMDADREGTLARIRDIAGDAPVADLLDAADHPVPEGWRPAMTFALDALEGLPRAKISVTARRVAITAMADSPAEKRRLEADLSRGVPAGLSLALEVTAPRPVITPFTTRFILDDEGARFSACAADTEEAQAAILSAASAAGLEGKVTCPLGLGVPSRTWGEAVALAIGAVDELGGGTVTVSDADVSLVALQGTEQDLFDRVAGELENALPDVFALDATLPAPPSVEVEEGPPEFSVTLSPEGQVQLRGRVTDDLLNVTAENYARARFGADVTMGTRVSENLPAGWSVRVLAGIEALSKLSSGSVLVQPDHVSVRGKTGNEQADSEISRLLIEKLGQDADFELAVVYQESLDPIAALPTPEECLQQITAVTSGRKITFDPGSANIAGDSRTIVDDIAEILRRCADLQIEIAGYTDSQGREEMNQQLSQERAEAVLTALRQRRVPTSTFTAVGYGEENPIADNDSEAGREANRRIEFSLVQPEGATDEVTVIDAEAEGEADTETDTEAATEDDAADTDEEQTEETE